MADVEVQNKSSKQSSETGKGELQRREGESGVSRRQQWDPFGSFLSSGEFFSANPFSMMRRMSEEMDRAFGRFFGESGRAAGEGWYPAVEVTEKNGQLHVSAELPGMNPEDVKVEVTNDSLIIHGERKSEHEHHIGRAYRSERRYGQFYRQISLPEGVNAEQAKAQFRNGLLEVTLPVPEQASKRRQIPISGGEAQGSSGTGTSTRASASAAGAGSSSGGGSGTKTK